MTAFTAPIAQQIWEGKYQFKTAQGQPIDQRVEHTWRRISDALAAPEGTQKRSGDVEEKGAAYWSDQFYDALHDFKYLPAGRITAGAGTDRNVTLFNCFVMGTVPDDMGGIFDMLKEAALTMQQGGGIGYDFSTLRPKGFHVKGVAADASGPLSFMDVWDAMCRTIMSAGSRRGAMMATMRCDHPDVMDFITAKNDPARLRMFNMSVLITDPFMEAVKNDDQWVTSFNGVTGQTYQARELWDAIMQNTYDMAEPGVIFIDRINNANNLNYCETISATNPCLAEGTLVSTSKGWLPVESISPGNTIATVTGAGEVESREIHDDTEVFEVSLSDGSSVKATAAHIFHVQEGKFFNTDKRLDQLSVGDKLRLAPALMPKNHDVLGERAKQEHLGFLAGVAIGDGCMTEKSRTLKVACRSDEPDWINTVEDRLGVFGATSVTKSTDQVHTVNSTPALGYLDRMGVARGKSAEKILPLSLLNSNRSFLRGFLDGLVSTDGNVHMSKTNPMIRVASNSRENLMQAKRALSAFGILARVYPENSKASGSETEIGGRVVTRRGQGHVLVILGEGVRKFHKNIPISRAAKQKRLDELVRNYSLTGCTWSATIKSITPAGRARVYDLFEPKTDTWIAEGIVHRGCGEQPLPPYGACLLGSINMAKMVKDCFKEGATVDTKLLEKTVRRAVRMMDNVVDASKFPLPQQMEEAKNKRRIGLGVTGLADMLIMLGLTYGSDDACGAVDEVMEVIAEIAYDESIELAKEKGPFPLFDADKFLKVGTFASTLSSRTKAKIRKHGIRNALLTSIAPTGTISLYAGNVSSGIEPVFALAYTRKVLEDDGTHREELVEDYAVQKYAEMWTNGEVGTDEERESDWDNKFLPDYFVTAQTLDPMAHIATQSAAQRWVDSSISKTVNVPEDISFEDFKEVYMAAWDSGCKGCTTYRPNAITGSVLSVDEPKTDVEVQELLLPPDGMLNTPVPRDDVMDGKTHKFKYGDNPNAIYVTINDIQTESGLRPYEIFINTKDPSNYSWTVAMTRMISAIFRRGGDVTFVVEELKAVFDPKGGAFMNGGYVPSLIAAIGGVIEKHMKETGYMSDCSTGMCGILPEVMPEALSNVSVSAPESCSQCNGFNFKNEGGCVTCGDCGHSKCG